jgi:hypothetical protein
MEQHVMYMIGLLTENAGDCLNLHTLGLLCIQLALLSSWHPNIALLYGYSLSGSNHKDDYLLYEYAVKGSLNKMWQTELGCECLLCELR